jgi:uncharacterized membrane protein
VKPSFWRRWQTNFVAGLILVLPAVVTLALLKWLFGTTTKLTNILIVPVPNEWKFVNGVSGEIWWYWSLAALGIAGLLVTLIGVLGRYYVGKKIIAAFDALMLRVPLLNKIYGTIKQVNEAFGSDRRSSFQHVVLVEFPRQGLYSLGFVTSEQNQEVQARTKEKVMSVFVPTTPNPTTGFLVLVAENQVTRLDMSVADGIRWVISLGAVAPQYFQKPEGLAPEAAPVLTAPAGSGKDAPHLPPADRSP